MFRNRSLLCLLVSFNLFFVIAFWLDVLTEGNFFSKEDVYGFGYMRLYTAYVRQNHLASCFAVFKLKLLAVFQCVFYIA